MDIVTIKIFYCIVLCRILYFYYVLLLNYQYIYIHSKLPIIFHLEEMHNFQKYSRTSADLLGTQYDYNTIMHYGKYAFSKNRQKTMKAIGSDRELGAASSLSPSDITALNALYDCASELINKRNKH